jgi:hypothetical protein
VPWSVSMHLAAWLQMIHVAEQPPSCVVSYMYALSSRHAQHHMLLVLTTPGHGHSSGASAGLLAEERSVTTLLCTG